MVPISKNCNFELLSERSNELTMSPKSIIVLERIFSKYIDIILFGNKNQKKTISIMVMPCCWCTLLNENETGWVLRKILPVDQFLFSFLHFLGLSKQYVPPLRTKEFLELMVFACPQPTWTSLQGLLELFGIYLQHWRYLHFVGFLSMLELSWHKAWHFILIVTEIANGVMVYQVSQISYMNYQFQSIPLPIYFHPI